VDPFLPGQPEYHSDFSQIIDTLKAATPVLKIFGFQPASVAVGRAGLTTKCKNRGTYEE
jgi:hypothetical protein